jgi:HD superfamily phosphohydrolase
MEDAIANYFSGEFMQPKDTAEGAGAGDGLQGGDPPVWYNHERVSQQICEKDPELRSILRRARIKPVELYSIFNRQNPPRLANLVSSDLDADRIDYLLRTAHHTGLPYGSVDLAYLLSQMRVDQDDRICITSKALRTADHFLLCRYFDYQQIAYHKTVVAFELVLKDVLAEMFDCGLLEGTASWVSQAIEKGIWHQFDDLYVLMKIRELAASTKRDVVKRKAPAILDRRPPKLVFDKEFLGGKDGEETYRLTKKAIKEKVAGWASHFGIHKDLWYLWGKSNTLTKIGSHVPVSALAREATAEEKDQYEQAVRILRADNSSEPIVENAISLMKVLADFSLYTVRLYVLMPSETPELRKTIEDKVRQDMG